MGTFESRRAGVCTVRIRGRRARPALRLHPDVLVALRQLKMTALFPVHRPDFRAIPAAAAILSSAAVLAVCASISPTGPAVESGERTIAVTVLDRIPSPFPDDPRASGTPAAEVRPASPVADIPPPPLRDIASPDWPPAVRAPERHAAVTTPHVTDAIDANSAPLAVGTPDLAAFWQRIREAVARRTVYPPSAVRRGVSGQVIVRIDIDSGGALLQAAVTTSSSDAALDQAALRAVREAAPFPPPPPMAFAAGATLRAFIPVRFELVAQASRLQAR